MKQLCTIALTFLLAHDVLALSSDRDQPLLVEADSAIVNEKKGTTIYRGNVVIDQGSIHIVADEVEFISHDGDIIQIIAKTQQGSGRLAHMEQQPDNEAKVYADARKISYFIQEERIHLAGNARLKQTEDEFSGELVFYDVREGIVNMKSDPNSQERIKIRYSNK